jgi:hypothetical protein
MGRLILVNGNSFLPLMLSGWFILIGCAKLSNSMACRPLFDVEPRASDGGSAHNYSCSLLISLLIRSLKSAKIRQHLRV